MIRSRALAGVLVAAVLSTPALVACEEDAEKELEDVGEQIEEEIKDDENDKK